MKKGSSSLRRLRLFIDLNIKSKIITKVHRECIPTRKRKKITLSKSRGDISFVDCFIFQRNGPKRFTHQRNCLMEKFQSDELFNYKANNSNKHLLLESKGNIKCKRRTPEMKSGKDDPIMPSIAFRLRSLSPLVKLYRLVTTILQGDSNIFLSRYC